MGILEQTIEGLRGVLPRMFWGTAILGVALVAGPDPAKAAVAAAGADVVTHEVRISRPGLALSGTLVLPANPTVRAAVVLVHGSGQAQRNLGSARALAAAGIATLTYDKRGVGRSGGTYAGPEVGTHNVDRHNLELLAADAHAALALLKGRPELQGVPAGYLGVSQAGWVIPMASSRATRPDFIVIWSGPVTTVHEELRFSALHGEASPQEYGFADTDPREFLAGLKVPGLWLFGGADTSIPVEQSIERLREVAHQPGNSYEYRVFPEAGHNLTKEAYAMTIQWIMSYSPLASRD